MKFKEMKFWIGDDQQLFLIVCNILESLGYDNPVTYAMYGNVAITTDKLGRVYVAGGYSENIAAQFHKWGNEEINLDWMRKPAKLETMETDINMTKITIDFGNDGYSVEAKLKKDGDMWCVMVGDNLQDGIAGFGKQVWEAIAAFKSNFRNI